MYKKIMKVVCGLALAAAALLPQPAAALKLSVGEAWRDTGVKVAAGDNVVAQVKKILRLQDGISLNSNGEWLYCWNTSFYKIGDGIRGDMARPLPEAPAGALIFRIGNGRPFFIPRASGFPGKEFTKEYTIHGYGKLAGYTQPATHQFKAPEAGPLYVSINLSEKARGAAWNWKDYDVMLMGHLPKEIQVSGLVTDAAGKPVAEAEVQLGAVKKITGADGAFVIAVPKDGRYTVMAGKNGYLSIGKILQVALAVNPVVDAGAFILRPRPGWVTGKIVTDDGRPAAGARVSAGSALALTNTLGNFTLSLPAGVYTLNASKTLPNGIQASGAKEKIEVLPGLGANAGQFAIMPTISGASGWLRTTSNVLKGQVLVVRATGEVAKGAQRFGPAGLPGKPAGAGAPLPSAPWGSLLARVGAGKPFLVGPAVRMPAVDSGLLQFAVNLPPAEIRSVTGAFRFEELTLLSLGNIEGVILGAGGKPLTLASVEIAGLPAIDTDANGLFSVKDVPANKVYAITVKFPGYNIFTRSVVVQLAKTASLGRVTLVSAPVTGTAAIKLLPKSGSTGGLIPVFVEVRNTSSYYGLWGGYLVSLKARHVATGKEYPGMSPTYLVLAPGEKKGTELLCQLPAAAPAGDYNITAELRVPETVSVQDAAKQFDAKKELEDKLAAMNKVTGRLAAQDTKRLNVVQGITDTQVAQAAKLVLPTITPKVFSPAKGQLVTGNIALREKSVIVLGKELEIFKDKSGAPLLIWNSYEGLYLSEREDGTRKDDWVWIGQSNVQSDDFTVNWDTSKFKDGDYLIRATMKTTYDNKPIEGSMNVMVKVRNDNRTGVIRGKLTDESGAPLYNADVKRLARGQAISGLDWDSLGTKTEVQWEAEDVVKTNTRGEYVFSGMMSGDYRLQFSLDKYATATKDAGLKAGQALNLPAVALEAEKCRVTGSVRLDDGGSAAGSQLALDGLVQLASQAGEKGAFAFEGLKKGAYRLTASRNDYDAAAADFVCAPGEAKSLPALLLKRALYQVYGTVSGPGGPIPGVTVTLDKAGAGTLTGDDGRFTLPDVAGGAHVLAFARAGYEPAEAQFSAAASSGALRAVTVDAALKYAKGTLTGKVIPAAADAFIDGAAVKLENGGRYSALLPAGEHMITVQKKAFETYEAKVVLKPGETLELDVKLEPARGSFKVAVSPADALVTLDGQAVENKGGEVSGKAAPGKHLLLAQANDRQSVEKEIEILSEVETALEIVLPALPGGIQGAVTPAAAKLEIDGVKIDADPQTGAFVKELAPGKHAVTASHGNLEPYSAEVEVGSGYTLLAIELSEKKAKKAAAVTAGVEEAFTGQPVALTVQTPDPGTEVELSVEKGTFEENEKNVIAGRSGADGKFTAKWATLTPARHKIKAKIGTGPAAEEKELELEVKYVTPQLDAVLKKIKASVGMNESVAVEAQVRNTGKVNGKYRFELELRGTSDLPPFTLKPVEVDLDSGENKTVKFDWTVTALGEFSGKLVVSLVGDQGELQRVATFQGALSFAYLGEMTGKIQVVGGKVKFSPEVKGVRMDYQVSDPGNLGLEKFDGQNVTGQCKVLRQLGSQGDVVFTQQPRAAQ